MTLYRVEFSRDWITGRWGFTDKVFHDLKGRETDPSRLENAWLVNFTGPAQNLGQVLSERLNIQVEDFQRLGAIFEITPLPPPDPTAGPEGHR